MNWDFHSITLPNRIKCLGQNEKMRWVFFSAEVIKLLQNPEAIGGYSNGDCEMQ